MVSAYCQDRYQKHGSSPEEGEEDDESTLILPQHGSSVVALTELLEPSSYGSQQVIPQNSVEE